MNSNLRTAQLDNDLKIPLGLMDRTVFVEEFRQRPLLNADVLITSAAPTLAQMALRLRANRDWEAIGTNATSALATAADGGGVTLTTAGASGDQEIVTPHLDTGQSALAATKWNTLDKIAIAVRLKTGASVADTTIWAGFKLTNTSVTATNDDQVFFRYQDTVISGNWQAVWSNTGTDSTADTGIAVAASTSYLLEIRVDSARVPYFFINGQLVVTGTALKSDVDLIPYVGVQTGASAAKAITVRKIALAKDLND